MRRALSFLLVRHPTRTACGLGMGMLLGVVSGIVQEWGWISIAPVSHPGGVGTVLGGLLVHVPSLFRKRDLPENVEIMFRATRRAVEEGGLSDVQRRMLYLRVAEAVISEHSGGASTRAVRPDTARGLPMGADEAPQALAAPGIRPRDEGGLPSVGSE